MASRSTLRSPYPLSIAFTSTGFSMDPQSFIRLAPEDLPPGVPLPWDVHDERGVLVMRAGAMPARDEQLERLLARGIFRPRMTADKVITASRSVFEQLQVIKLDVRASLKAIVAGTAPPSVEELLTLTARIRALAWKHPDAVLGGLQLDSEAAYTEIHPIMVAVISELVARRIGINEAQRIALCAAALTSNVGMLDLQDVLCRQTAPLDDAQRQTVRAHPQLSLELLRGIGVGDADWLRIVLDHHERLDGSGYPHGKRGEEIDQLTAIVALADTYGAMVLPREYRDGFHAQRALREIFIQRGTLVNAELAQLFIKELGVYPPGVFVTMKNGERGIVIKRGTKAANAPVVSCFASARQEAYSAPIVRDTSAPGAQAIATVSARQVLNMPLEKIWGLPR